MSLWHRKQTVLAGLALHDDRFSMVSVRKTKQKMILEAAIQSDISAELKPEQISAHIRHLVQGTSLTQCDVVLSLPSSYVLNKRIKLPAFFKKEERDAEISANIHRYLPGINEELYFDYGLLEQHDTDDEWLLVAARKEQVMMQVSLAEQAGLKVKVADVDTYALLRAVWFSVAESEQIITVLNVDTVLSQLIVQQPGKIIFTHALTGDVEFSIAEQLKRGLQLYSAGSRAPLIKKIYLTGRYQQVMDIHPHLRKELDIPCELFSFNQSIQVTEQVHDSEFAMAFGLAIRSHPA